MSVKLTTDFAWVIEAPSGHYLATRSLATNTEFFWTTDDHRAVRFMSKEQADGVMMAVRQLNRYLFGFAAMLGEARPVEHGWLTSRSALSQEKTNEQ